MKWVPRVWVYPLKVWWAREGLTMTPGVLLMLTATTAAAAAAVPLGRGGLFGVKLIGGGGGDDDAVAEAAEIFAVAVCCCGGMSIVRVSLPKMSRKRLVGAGNADGECCLGGVWFAAAAAMAAVTGPSAEGCRITEG